MTAPEPTPAFSAVYEEHFAFVWAALRRLGVRDADLDDVAQDVFVIVHRRLDDYEARGKMRTWLYGIAVRVVWNYARSRSRQPTMSETSSSGLAAPHDDGDPERFAQRQEANGLLQELLGKLDPAKRTVFVLAELEGLTAPEIAEVTGANTRTVYSRLRAARSRMSAGLARVRARESNDVTIRELSRTGAAFDQPPPQAQRRAWAALMVKLAAPMATPVATAGIGAALKVAAIGIGVAAVTVGAVHVAGPDEPALDPRGAVAGAAAPGEEQDKAQARQRGPKIDRDADAPPAAEQPSAPEPEAAPAPPTAFSGSPVDAEALALGENPDGKTDTASPPPGRAQTTDGTAQPKATPRTRVPTSGRSGSARPPAPSTDATPPDEPADAPAAPSEEEASTPETPKPAAAPVDPVMAEFQLMAKARAALKAGRPKQGLRLLDEHASRFPKGKLAPERRRSRLTALCALGREAEASKAARALGLLDHACP